MAGLIVFCSWTATQWVRTQQPTIFLPKINRLWAVFRKEGVIRQLHVGVHADRIVRARPRGELEIVEEGVEQQQLYMWQRPTFVCDYGFTTVSFTDIILQQEPRPSVTYKTIGGILDFSVFIGSGDLNLTSSISVILECTRGIDKSSWWWTPNKSLLIFFPRPIGCDEAVYSSDRPNFLSPHVVSRLPSMQMGI